jgi:thioredoxin reductase (NADPH)
MTDDLHTDALIVGAGPVGLYMAFQLGLLEISAHIVDALPYPGGQPETLYPDKPIYDLPGLPCISGRDLTASLRQQIAPMNVPMHLGDEVSSVTVLDHPEGKPADAHTSLEPTRTFLVSTRQGLRIHTRCLFVAAGVGAFQARPLKVADASGVDVARFEGAQLFYHLHQVPDLAGQHVLVLGGEDDALKAAIHAAQTAQRVTLLHRREVFKAEPQVLAQFNALRQTGAVEFIAGQALHYVADEATGRLTQLQVLTPEGHTVSLDVDVLLVFLGLSPKLGPVAEWNLAMSRKQVEVSTETFATSVPGIFAVGDINTYPGKKKLLVSGFHECALAAFGAAAYLRPNQPTLLQYTTTSSKLHQILGVAHPDKI